MIVGLGNPGLRYETTRHNIGQMIVLAFAKSQGWHFTEKKALQARACSENNIHLVLPTTYMNLSGIALQKALVEYPVDIADVLVVTDDIYLPFGEMRLRDRGSSGGHNGLKNIQAYLETDEYARLRIGIGEPQGIDLDTYVVSDFTPKECEEIPNIIQKSIPVIDFWIRGEKAKAKEWTHNS